MRRKMLVLALVLLVLCMSVGGSLAYFTQEEIAHNIITTGGVEIELIEKAIVDGEEVDFEDVDGVMPGAEVSKIVTVENTGANDAYVRVMVSSVLTLAPGQAGEPDYSLIGIDFNLTDWTSDGEGYWYYNSALKPGETTAPLFTTVTFDTAMDNLYQGSTFEIDVAAQAVQTANNGSSALTAAGWPV